MVRSQRHMVEEHGYAANGDSGLLLNMPVIGHLNPASISVTAADFDLEIHGEEFTIGSVVWVGDEAEPRTAAYFDPSLLSILVRPSMWQPGTVPIRVQTGPYISDPIDFTFTA